MVIIDIDINQKDSEIILLFKNLGNYVKTRHIFNIGLI